MGIEKPVVILAGSGGTADLFSRPEVRNLFGRVPEIAHSPAEAVSTALSLIRESGEQ